MIAAFFRFCATQGVAYVLDFGVFWVSMHALGVNPLLANILGKIAGNALAFFMHRAFTFQKKTDAEMRGDAVRYGALVAVNLPMSSAILWVLLHWLSPGPAKVATDAIGLVINYFLARLFVFRAATTPTSHDRT